MSILLHKITPISTSPFQYSKTKIINIIQIIPNSKHQRSQNQLPKNNRENFIQKSCHVSVMSKSCQKLYQRSNSMSPPLVVPFFFLVIAMIHQLSLIELKSLTCLILGITWDLNFSTRLSSQSLISSRLNLQTSLIKKK